MDQDNDKTAGQGAVDGSLVLKLQLMCLGILT